MYLRYPVEVEREKPRIKKKRRGGKKKKKEKKKREKRPASVLGGVAHLIDS
jgi:hypothetical protein